MKLSKLLAHIPFYTCYPAFKDVEINGIEMDSRRVEQNDLFVCIKGYTVDGHDFANEAVQRGATVIVSERPLEITGDALVVVVPDTNKALAILATSFYHHPSSKLSLIGITGTNGKTTTTYLIEQICKRHGQKTGVIGTIQTKIGDEVIPVVNTTPDALTLQRYFAKMVEANVDTAVMEVSSHALALGRVYGTDYKIALYTNLSQDHLDFHESMDDYLRAKTLLFSSLGNDYKQPKYAVVNRDDTNWSFIAKSTSRPVITYSMRNDADVQAKNVRTTISDTSFLLKTPVGTVEVTSKMLGTFNVYNMLAATSVALLLHIPLETIKEALESMNGVPGRFERVEAGQDFAVIVDYAHTPDSLENVLQTIQTFAEKKIYTVVGSGGDRDRTKRPLMAQAALKYSDYAIFTSDNPRTEDPYAILQDMTDDLTEHHYEVIENRKEAIKRAVSLAERGDVILIAGKGHETYQEINGVRYDFDDRLVARDVIIEKGTK